MNLRDEDVWITWLWSLSGGVFCESFPEELMGEQKYGQGTHQTQQSGLLPAGRPPSCSAFSRRSHQTALRVFSLWYTLFCLPAPLSVAAILDKDEGRVWSKRIKKVLSSLLICSNDHGPKLLSSLAGPSWGFQRNVKRAEHYRFMIETGEILSNCPSQWKWWWFSKNLQNDYIIT